MREISEEFINRTKENKREGMHKGLDLLLDVIEATSVEYLSDTKAAIEGYAGVLKKYCATLLAMEEIKNAK